MTKPRKRFGQHFLRDPNIIRKIIQSFQLKDSDHCVEIGPGEGVLTTYIVERCRQLTAIEIDRDLVSGLKIQFVDDARFRLINEDILKVDLSTLALDAGSDFKPPWRVVGNLPYNISTPLLFHLLKYKIFIQDMHFMLQKEVVDRITAKVSGKNYGRLSVMMQYHCECLSLFTIGPNAFYPPPKVDSAIVRLIPHAKSPYPDCDSAQLSDIVRQAFAHRRKTIANNLKGVLTPSQIEAAGIEPGTRPETISVAGFVALTNQLHAAS